MPSKQDLCACGGIKDTRAKQCRNCFRRPARESKICTICYVSKPLDSFRTRIRSQDGIPIARPHCRDCEASSAQDYRKAYPDKHTLAKRAWEKKNPEKLARQQLRRKARALGLDPDLIVLHFESHSGLCDICGSPPSNGFKNLTIDHCHASGAFRGLLCSPCNLALGLLKDDHKIITAAAEYVLRLHS